MEFQYLKYFASVARLGSFARAAAACHVSQPALSVQVRKLEDSLGTKLLNRSTQKVSLTKEGELLLPRVEQILAEIETLAHSARALGNPWELPWTIGITPALSYSSLFERLRKTQERHPGFLPSFREMAAPDLLSQLRSQTIDLAAIPWAGNLETGDLLSVEIDRVSLVAIRPKGPSNPKLECISVHPGCGLRPALEQCALSMGSALSSRHLAHHTDMLKHWVRLGLGWSIIPKSALHHDDKRDLKIEVIKKAPPLVFRLVALDTPRHRAFFAEFA